MRPEQRIPQNHLLRPVRAMADEALRDLSLLHRGLEQVRLVFTFAAKRQELQ
jgi:hypothetical protein